MGEYYIANKTTTTTTTTATTTVVVNTHSTNNYQDDETTGAHSTFSNVITLLPPPPPTTTTTGTTMSMESTDLLIAVAKDAATDARQKRRRRVQLLRQRKKRRLHEHHDNDNDDDTERDTMPLSSPANEPRNSCATTQTCDDLSSQQQQQPKVSNSIPITPIQPKQNVLTTSTLTAVLPFVQSLLDRHNNASSHTSNTISNNINKNSNNNIGVYDQEKLELLVTKTVIIPDVNGIQDLCHRLYERRECVAIPTECTYEIIQPFQYDTATTTVSSSSSTISINEYQQHQQSPPPHVYIPHVSMLDTCPFWKHLLPKKSYAIRNKSTTDMAFVATFNESIHVLRRISTKCWPGPILIYVQVPQAIPGITVTTTTTAGTIPTTTPKSTDNSNDDTEACVGTKETNVQQQHYIALRKPCHPLSRKVCTEFYKQQQQQHQQQQSKSRNCSSNTSSCVTTPSASPMFTSNRTVETPMLSSAASSSSSLQIPQLVSSPPASFIITPCRRVESSVSLVSTTPFVPDESSTSSLIDESERSDSTATLPVALSSFATGTTNVDGNLVIHSTTHKVLTSLSLSSSSKLSLLVGTPMMKRVNNKKTNDIGDLFADTPVTHGCTCTEHVNSANDAVVVMSQQERDDDTSSNNNNVTAVLDGEERYEILAVPTCMYQTPYPISIWIDSSDRKVRIKNTNHGKNHQQCHQHHHHSTGPLHQRRTMSPQSIMLNSSSFLSLQEQPYVVDETSILQSLRAVVRTNDTLSTSFRVSSVAATTSNTTNPLSPKERVLHAVLLKWKVVTVE